MSDTLDWICNEIGADRAIILSRRHDKSTVFLRRVAYNFFRLKGKSSTWIGNLFNRDHSSVLVALNCSTPQILKRATELFAKYETAIEGKNINELKIEFIRPKITIKVPNYKTGGIETREMFADEYEDMKKRRVAGWWQKNF